MVRAVEDRLHRALAVLRVVLTANMVALNVFRLDNFSRPVLGMVVVGALVAWTGFVIWASTLPRRRVPLLFLVDLAVAVAALLSTLLVKGTWFNASVPGFWVAGALLAWGIQWRWRGGLVAATVVSAVDLLSRDAITQTNYANIFLLMIAGPIVGYLCGSLQEMAASRAVAEREAATAAERARLARAVHDGVLQVLALMQRRGPEIGGDAVELGALAGAQEQALRALIRQQDGLVAAAARTSDLTAAIDRLGTSAGTPGRPAHVNVSTPGTPLPLPTTVVTELVEAVGECLANVARHVGAGATAWVLLEDLGDRVVITVRDDGPGIPAGRLAEAAAAGRLGVASSIRGRVEDLGGTVALVTAPGQGTEWEFTVPQEETS